jgi:hypothetical protein
VVHLEGASGGSSNSNSSNRLLVRLHNNRLFQKEARAVPVW